MGRQVWRLVRTITLSSGEYGVLERKVGNGTEVTYERLVSLRIADE
jgi:hypothetical protein